MGSVGPPGASHDAVSRLVNLARVGVVCGEADGAPAILTDDMLAGLPVLANVRLACGLQLITPRTGMAAPAALIAQKLGEMLSDTARFSPTDGVRARWTWPHRARRLEGLLRQARSPMARASSVPGPTFQRIRTFPCRTN